MKFYAIRKTDNGVESWATISCSSATYFRIGPIDKYTRLYEKLNGAYRSYNFALKHQLNKNDMGKIELVELELDVAQVIK